MSIEQQLEVDAFDAFIAGAKAYESEILDFADTQLKTGENSIANALEGGFRAKVPLAGGSIGNAIGTAISQLEAEEIVDLKTGYDATLARIVAARDALAAGG